MAYSAGTAFLQIQPSFEDVEKLLAQGARNMTKGLDKALGEQLAKATQKAGQQAQPKIARTGSAMGRTLAEAMMRRVQSALASIPATDRVLKPLRQELVSLSEVDIGKGFNEKDFIARIEKVQDALRRAQQDAQGPNMVSRFTNAGNAAQELGAVRDIVEQARKRGFEAGDAFGDAYLNRLKAMDRVLPDLKVTAKSSQEERAVAALKARIAEAMRLQVGDVATRENNPLSLKIGARIDADALIREMGVIEGQLDQFSERFSQRELVLPLEKASAQAGAFFSDIQTRSEKAEQQAAEAQLRAREQTLREYERLWEQAELRNRQRADEEAKRAAVAAERELAEQNKLVEEQEKAYEQYLASVARLDQQNRDLRLRQQRTEFEQRARELKRSRDAELAAERRHVEELNRLHEQALRENVRRQQQAAQLLQKEADRQRSQTTIGQAQSLLGKARDRIIDIPVHLQANAIDREMAAIRQRIERLGDVKLGVKADVEAFADEVQREFTRLRQIARDNDIDIEVRADAARAATELGGILVLLNRIDGNKAEVKVDADSAAASLRGMLGALTLNLGRLGALIAIGASMGTAIVPAAAAAASAIGAIGTAALAAGAGIGVMMLGFSGIGDAVKAMGQLADNQQKATGSLNRSASQIAAANDQIESAERALAETRRNNAQAAVKAQRDIQDALRDQKDTVEDVARANEDAAERVTRAQRALKDTIDDVREANERAAERVTDAQRDLTRATEDERAARDRLTEAYRQAERVLQDLHSAIRGNALDQRQAILDIAEAKQELDKLLSNPRASQEELEQARITYERRLLQMEDLKRSATDMEDEQRKRWEQGVDGVEEVVDAQRGLEDAQDRLKDAQSELADAEREQQKTRLKGIQEIKDAQTDLMRAERDAVRVRADGIRRLSEAQRKVDDARKAAAEQQRDAAYAEFQAQQSLIAARRALANAMDKSLSAGGAQLDNLNTAMGKLSPTAQKFARYIFGLRDAFFALRAATDPMIAGLQDAMEQLLGRTSEEAQKKLAPLFDFVGRVATALGGIFRRIGELVQGPEFTRFFSYISDTAVPMLWLMYQAFENITVGFLNLFMAFTPLSEDVADGFLGLTESFRRWSDTLETNQGFQSLLGYIRDSGPAVMALLGEMFKAIGNLVVAAAPVGIVVVQAFTEFFELLNKIPQDVLTTLVAGIAAAAGAIALFAGATAIASLSIPGLIAGGIALLVVAFSAAVGSSETLRDALVAAWERIKQGAQVAFGFLGQVIGGMRPVFDGLVDAALSFYNNGIKPAFDAVKALVTSAFQALKPSFDDMGGFLKQLGDLAVWLYSKAIVPAFDGIMTVIGTLLPHVKPIFEILGTIIGGLGRLIFWLLNKVVMPVVTGIVKVLVAVLTPVIKFLWTNIVKPILGGIGIAFEVLAAIVKVAIGVITLILKGLGALFGWLYREAIRPLWIGLRDNVFKPMAEWFDKHIRPHWDRGIKGLGKIWDGLKKIVGTPVKFVVETVLNNGLLKGYNWLADKFDIEPKNVKIPPPSGGWGFASGGAVYGPGTETSDSIPARLSRGEHVLTAKEVRAAGGHQAIYAWRRDLLRGHRHGYATGGAVGRGIGDGFGDWLKKTAKSIGKKASDAFDSAAAFIKDPLGSIKALATGLFNDIPGKDTWIVQRLIQIPKNIVEELKKRVTGLFSGGGEDGGDGITGNSNALGGSGGMMRVLRAVFPGLPLNSGYRPGSITVTGNLSYHSRNRAVDVPPRSDVFEWIRRNYPGSRELIFSPKGNRQIHNGRPHFYTGAVRNTHYDHVHWAYDQGGLLPDTRRMPGGVMQVFHGKRTPDKVLTDTQWQHMAILAAKAQESMAGGNTYNFPYRDSTLDYDELNRWSARQDALARVNRRNY